MSCLDSPFAFNVGCIETPVTGALTKIKLKNIINNAIIMQTVTKASLKNFRKKLGFLYIKLSDSKLMLFIFPILAYYKKKQKFINNKLKFCFN